MKVHQLLSALSACEPEDDILIDIGTEIGDMYGFNYDSNAGEFIIFMMDEREDTGAQEEEELDDDDDIPLGPDKHETDEEGRVIREA